MMSQLTVAALGNSLDSCRQLKIALQAAASHAEIFASTLPMTTAALAELGRLDPAVVLVEISPTDSKIALDGMGAVHNLLPKAKVVAIGDANDSITVLGAMRAGACDFLEAPLETASLARVTAQTSTARRRRGRIFSFINAKGGSGSTTLAVNLSLVLASISRRVALLDLAVPGNAELHLDLKPSFTVVETARNLHRLDALLLEGMMTKHPSGLHLLAGASEPEENASVEQLAGLLDVVTARYEFVVVDISTRVDAIARAMCEFSDAVLLVGQPDVASMFSARRMHSYLAQSATPDKIKLVLNRYRKMAGVNDTDFEKASGCELVWTVPNQYATVSNSITNGIPVVQQSSTDLREHFFQFARVLTGTKEQVQTVIQQARTGKSLLERVASLRSFGALGGAKVSA